jgi:hypothetical protein
MNLPLDLDNQRKPLTPTYNRARALQSVKLESTEYVKEIAYNAKGQKNLVALDNEIMTRYAYDNQTFRLKRMKRAISKMFSHSKMNKWQVTCDLKKTNI